jgi:hypothetical protein
MRYQEAKQQILQRDLARTQCCPACRALIDRTRPKDARGATSLHRHEIRRRRGSICGVAIVKQDDAAVDQR